MVGFIRPPCDAGIIRATTAVPVALSRRRKQLTLAATILGSSLALIDGSVVNIALPAIQQALHADAASTQWIVNAYLLLLGALGGVDSRDSLLGANQIQGCFWGGSLGCDGTVGFERRGVGADSAADHRPA